MVPTALAILGSCEAPVLGALACLPVPPPEAVNSSSSRDKSPKKASDAELVAVSIRTSATLPIGSHAVAKSDSVACCWFAGEMECSDRSSPTT
jgi:hypothetical protein